jgi:peptidoglycan-associated lipoprotein
MMIRIQLAWLTLAALSLGACSRKRAAEPAPAPTPASTSTADADRARRDSLARAEAQRDSAERAERERADLERLRAEKRATLEAPVHFGFDQSDLEQSAIRQLEAKRAILAGSPDVRLRISGHADERGSDEYNLALGQRRAAAAMRYLTDRDINPARLEIVSLGEERPVCTVSDESCWSRNRRAEFEITAGGDRIALR